MPGARTGWSVAYGSADRAAIRESVLESIKMDAEARSEGSLRNNKVPVDLYGRLKETEEA